MKVAEFFGANKASREQSFLLFIAGGLGVLCGLVAVFFEWLIEVFRSLFMHGPDALMGDSYWYHYLLLPLTPAIGGLLMGVIVWKFKLAPESAAAAEVMKWTAVDGGRVRKRVIIGRLLSTSVFLGSGGSGGREGPIAQICGALGSTLGQWMRVSTERLRLLVGCGAAAGIAAAFNAPIAGVIFTVELVLADFNVTSFLPIVIASVMATTTKRLVQGDIPAFEAPPYMLVSPWEIFLYFLLGIVCGLVAVAFFKLYFAADDFFKYRVKVHPIVKPAIGGLGVGLIGIFLPEVFGSGYETMDLMLNDQMLWTTAILLIVFKIVATSLSLGSGGSGGVFAPSLFIGCMVGGAFGSLANQLFPGDVATPGGYAMVGIGAVMSAVVHAPLTNILMGYELTGNYQIILPIMTSCIMSAYVMTWFSSESLYTEKLRRRGIRLWRGRDLAVMDQIKVGEVMRKWVTPIREDQTFREIMAIITTSRDAYFPVVDAEGKLTGVISMQNIREFLLESEELADLIVAKEIATPRVITVDAADNLNDAMARFTEIDIEQLPVVSASDPRQVIGMLSRMDVMATYKKEVLKRTTD